MPTPRLSRTAMCHAIDAARRNIKRLEGGPFGACVVKDGKVIARGRNTVLKGDATAHAELNAIRIASKKLKTFDLSGCTIYSTTEPCPMCFSAIHWARIERVVFGTRIADAKQAGFNELTISNRTLKRLGKSKVKLTAGFMRRECEQLFVDWASLPKKKTY